jgi:predicted double-glycine peptidase
MSRSFAWLGAGVLLAILIGTPLVALDKPKTQPREHGQYFDVPVGAIKVPLPDVQQGDGFSCGAASLMSVCSYYHVGPRDLDSYRRELGTTEEEGTYYGKIKDYARKLGLTAKVETAEMTKMSIDKLKDYLGKGIPVICSIQAWGGDKADYDKDGNGHYVVAIGYDEKNIYFMDPYANHENVIAKPRYAYLSEKEFERRWHEDETMKKDIGKKNEKFNKLGIAIQPMESPLLRARMIE